MGDLLRWNDISSFQHHFVHPKLSSLDSIYTTAPARYPRPTNGIVVAMMV